MIIDLAFKAGKKRQSLQTGFIHYCYEGIERHDTIPLLENFSFVLTLFRMKSVEHILEGKQLLEKLLAFQVEDNFPVYLHEYPVCRDLRQNSRIYPVLYWIDRDFHMILGEDLKNRVKHLLTTLLKPTLPEKPNSPESWAKYLIVSQLENLDPKAAFAPYDPVALTYVGIQKQEWHEPALTLYDLYMAEATGVFPKRALNDHPAHLNASLIQPFSSIPSFSPPSHPDLLFWGNEGYTHSLYFEYRGERSGADEICLEGEFELDAMEIAAYLNLQPEAQIYINQQKATTFHLNDEVEIHAGGKILKLKFSLKAGEGMFFGHLLRGNRPNQIAAKGENRYEAYDWKIGLRTLRRGSQCIIKYSLNIS